MRALDGIRRLSDAGMLPIVTMTQPPDEDPIALHARARAVLVASGVPRPRLKLLPMFQLGRETLRTRDYSSAETLADLPEDSFDATRLQCGHCRAVTSRGVFVCPLLVDEPAARMGDRLDQSLDPFTLRHGACYTCAVTGMTCANG